MKKIISLSLLLTCQLVFAQFDYSPSAKSAREATETKLERAQKLYDYYAAQPLGKTPVAPKVGFEDFIMTSIARMKKGTELEKVSANLLNPNFKPWAIGTDISLTDSLCKRQGDYDFVLMGLIHMAFLDLESGDKLLIPQARHKLRHELLSQSGINHHIKFTLKNCMPFKIKDSENHILMAEISRYLTNQILYKESRKEEFNNQTNGFDNWMLTHLSEFLRHDFDELNSRPYQGYTLIALAVLHNYADSAKVRLQTELILDYVSAKSAVQSKGLRRYAPFRRQLKHRDASHFSKSDNGMFWYSFHSGNPDYLKMHEASYGERFELNHYMYFMASLDDYQIPSLIHELFYESSQPIFQTLKARDVEIYHNSPTFLLSSGGRYRKVFGYFTRENDVWALPTTIIPKKSGVSFDQVFALRGESEFEKRNNLCVTKGFACGKNLSVPSNIPTEDIHPSGAWTFYDLSKQGHFVATYEKKPHAFFEVREADISFQDFKSNILKSNGSKFESRKENTFITSNGESIVFNWDEKNLNRYPITSINGVATKIETDRWLFAEGNVISSKGDGEIQIQNPETGERLILDNKDIMNPKKRRP